MPELSRSALLAALASIGCAAVGSPSSPVATLERQLAERGAVVFRSHDGVAYRMDHDIELVFRHTDVLMLIYGFRLHGCRGSYELKPTGLLVTRFNECDEELPVMQVEGKAGLFRLRPQGPVLEPDRSLWSFRMLSGRDESEVLQMLREHHAPPEGR